MEIEVIRFDEALARSAGKTRHVLLGNGFSIACRPDCFAYGSLLEEADLAGMSVDGLALFKSIDTTDFERVIASLRAAERVVGLYATSDPGLANRLLADADQLKDALAATLASNHPDDVGTISDDEYRSARNFLQHFDRVFTLNYDLLLYWSLIQEMEPPVVNDDGFRAADDPDADYVVWNHLQPHKQTVYYLHGGLHLFDGRWYLKKVTWSKTGVPIVSQIRTALDLGEYPLVVTEGTSEEKASKILHHGYLEKGMRSLASCGGSLFVFGHSLAENDDHVLEAIARSKISTIFVSLFGASGSADNQVIVGRAMALAARRTKKPPSVVFYDAGSAQVWDHEEV